MATILEGLNKLSGKLGGAETATENLEALNAIAGALGGETNATSNADAIDQIAEHASGGGSSDFSTVEVTVTNNSTRDVYVYAPIRVEDGGMSFAGFQLALTSGTHETVNAILCQDAALCNIDTSDTVNIAATGSIQVIPDSPMCQITGSGTITISDPQ